ncbi:MAG: hypothetical protein M3Q40_07655 [Pseudomonadota bacterium]|nr:hypothetical protein [Pseudomonadota bacterium]
MTASTFRFTSSPFNSRVRAALGARKPRNGVLRAILGVVGLGLLAVLVVLGVVIGAAMLAAGVIYKLAQGRGSLQRARDERVVDAEYRVVAKPLLPR